MSFLNPLLLLAGLGVALPILAHLLNRYQVKRTDWAAMQFLNRSVRIRSRQLRLRDIFLLCLRCLAILLLVSALAQPFMREAEAVPSGVGERRAGVVIGLDASYSMGHGDGAATRFGQALEKIGTIAEGIHPGDPVSLVLLGTKQRVVARNMAFDPARFDELLEVLQPSPESLDLDSVPQALKALAVAMDAPQKEIYFVTDMQAGDWSDRPAWLGTAFGNLGESAATTIVPVGGGADNLAITDLELVSGVLRKDTVARYRATVRNFGTSPVANVRVKGLADDITVDTKTIPAIAPGASETVSLFVHFRNAGPVRIGAELEPDSLLADNTRRTVAVIRDEVSVLSVEGSPGGTGGASGSFIAAALRARGGAAAGENFAVQSVPWIELPAQELAAFDVVILQNVPEITPEQALAFESYVRAGHGLIWFAGDKVDAAAWNKRSALDGVSLLPAVIEQTVNTSDALGVGRPLDPGMPDHPVCRPLRSLPEDLLSETRFRKVLQVKPAATSSAVLSLAGTAAPLLLEHSVGRGQVFMFTTSADSAWNNMAVTPVFPMVLQQMVTYLTAREFETPRLVGDSLSLSYVEQPDASEAVFDTPSGETISVPVREHRNQYVAMLEHARESGFYLARVSLQAPGMPVAVNVDTAESDVGCLSPAEVARAFDGTDITVAQSEADLLDAVEESRAGRSFWHLLLLAGLGLLVVESLLANWMTRRPEGGANQTPPAGAKPENA
ncbi:MAG: VWA domain-containing protein [Akkermansiaceae bacterium]|nr:VWA domain-containing protein [Akkermansiaceae bacterium]